ncbi:MAG TPA: GNAT family N-acetyltransferase [Phycisphaeraceae bacterium]
MANCKIDIVGKQDIPLLTQLYNEVFQPARTEAFFERRFLGRHNELIMLAVVDGRPVGFFVGFELKPDIFFEWLYGVVPAYRRQGIASQLMEAVHAWARDQGYEACRFECHNQHRPMLHLAIANGYDIVGIRWDPSRLANLVIFEKDLRSED